MEPTEVTKAAATILPEWATAVGSFLVFMVTFAFAAYGWIKQKFPTIDKAKPTGEAVVLSAAIADSAAINRLATAIEGMIAADSLNRIELQLIEKRLQLIHGEVRSVNELLAKVRSDA